MDQQISFGTTPDGTRLAYAEYGPPSGATLVLFGGYDIGQESVWRLPDGKAFLEELAGMRRLITFDYRGLGASQRDVGPNDRDVDLADLDYLADHLGLTEFDLFAIWPDGATYAARRPARVKRLILWAPTLSSSPFPAETLAMIRNAWGLYTRALATVIYPGGPPEALRWISDALRASCTPDYYVTTVSTTADYRPDLPQVKCPTLVLHPVDTQDKRVEDAREVAALIPGARFVALPGGCSLPFWDRERYSQTLQEFLGVVSDGSSLPSGTAIILFADIADSTALTERLGDAAFRAKARALDQALRHAIRSNAGAAIEGKLLGDGVLATFPSAAQAIACAQAIHAAGSDVELTLHVGIHAGDVIREDNNVFGGAVNIAARICALSAPGEVLVSRTVADLARTSADVTFEDRGEYALKGIVDAVRVYGVKTTL